MESPRSETVAHKRKGAVNIRLGSTHSASWLQYACIALLLLATTFQAAHVCGLQTADRSDVAQFQSGSLNRAVCLTCLLAQSTSAGLISVAFVLALRRSASVCFPQSRPRPFLQSFQLYVRPPPAC